VIARGAHRRAVVDFMIDYAARRFREEVMAWPDGVYEADAFVDHDPLGNPDIKLHVKITVDGDDLKIDYTGSDTRQEIQAWSTFGNTRGYTIAQVASMMDPEYRRTKASTDRSVVPQGAY
jgi:N-methylhydantoinase B